LFKNFVKVNSKKAKNENHPFIKNIPPEDTLSDNICVSGKNIAPATATDSKHKNLGPEIFDI